MRHASLVAWRRWAPRSIVLVSAPGRAAGRAIRDARQPLLTCAFAAALPLGLLHAVDRANAALCATAATRPDGGRRENRASLCAAFDAADCVLSALSRHARTPGVCASYLAIAYNAALAALEALQVGTAQRRRAQQHACLPARTVWHA